MLGGMIAEIKPGAYCQGEPAEKRGELMSEWEITIKETRMLKYHIEGNKDQARSSALEKAVSGDLPDDSSVQHEVDDQVEIS